MSRVPYIVAGVLVGLFSVVGLGCGLCLYGGVWYCTILPIVDFIRECKAVETDAWVIAWCLVRFFVLSWLAIAAGFYGFLATGAIATWLLFVAGKKAQSPADHVAELLKEAREKDKLTLDQMKATGLLNKKS